MTKGTNTLLLICVALFSCVFSAAAQSHSVPASTIGPYPVSPGNSIRSVIWQGGVAVTNSTIASSGSATYAPSHTRTGAFMRVITRYMNAPADHVPLWWQMSREVGSSDPLKEGPYNEAGQPTTPGGDPVDENGDPIPDAPEVYEWTTTLFSEVGSSTYTLRVIRVSDSAQIATQSFTVMEGASRFVRIVHRFPFDVEVTKAFFDPLTNQDRETVHTEQATGTGQTPEEYDGTVPVDANAPPAFTNGPPGSGDDSSERFPGEMDAPPPVGDSPRPGDGEGNAEARHAEMRAEMQRLVQSVNNGQNQDRVYYRDSSARDRSRNELLGDIGEGIDGLGDSMEGLGGLGDSLEGVADGLGEAVEALEGDASSEGESAGLVSGVEGSGSLEKAQALVTATSGLFTSLTGFAGALSMPAPGTHNLQFTLNLPSQWGGTQTVNLTSLSSTASVLRLAVLALLGFPFAIAVINTIRGAFAS